MPRKNTAKQTAVLSELLEADGWVNGRDANLSRTVLFTLKQHGLVDHGWPDKPLGSCWSITEKGRASLKSGVH
jgi:hypothetical protein